MDLDRQALEDLVVDNADLERLESLLGQFNIFEAVGMVRQELRHSDFLGFLLDPRQPHGLGDAFLRKFLQRALVATRGTPLPVSLIDLDVWGLDDVLVLREWNNIDLLLLSEENRLAVVIENKIGSGEHSGQLERYRCVTSQHYDGWALLALYLTPEGASPSETSYLPVGYRQVADLAEELAGARASVLGPDVLALLRHYVQMLRRHIVSDSEIDDLCRRIYQKHRRALDLIYERRPDLQTALSEFLRQLVTETDGFVLDYTSKAYITFAPAAWDALIPQVEGGNNWSPKGRIIRFWFENLPERLRLILQIGPGPESIQPVRQRLWDLARARRPPFKPSQNALPAMYGTIYSRVILNAGAYEDAGMDVLTAEIRKQWSGFLSGDFTAIDTIITNGLSDSQ